MLTLSTTYVNANGDTKYVPRSKYKVVDSETGELVGFTKTATGDYRKSNLDDATTVITLKAGQVELQGLEVGRYEVGLVDVTDGFAMQKEEPEYITLVGNDEKDINLFKDRTAGNLVFITQSNDIDNIEADIILFHNICRFKYFIIQISFIK